MSDSLLAESETSEEQAAPEDAKASEEGKGAEESKDLGTAQDEDRQGAPETYEDFQIPEGMELDKAALEAFAPVAKEANLSQEQAQRLVSLYAGQLQQATEANQKAWTDMQEQWVSQAKEDKEFGGRNFDQSLGLAATAMEKFGTDELKEVLNATGAGNNPELIRFFVRVGKALGEAEVSFGKSNGRAPRDRASILYPNQGN
jgi:hypothetical protein